MRFMMLVILPADGPAEAGQMPSPEAVVAMGTFNDQMRKAGILLGLDGFHPTSKGARVNFSGDKRSVKYGPFPGAKEIVGGYWLIDVKSRDDAIEWATRAPNPGGPGKASIEIRQIFELSDFPQEVQQAVRSAG